MKHIEEGAIVRIKPESVAKMCGEAKRSFDLVAEGLVVSVSIDSCTGARKADVLASDGETVVAFDEADLEWVSDIESELEAFAAGEQHVSFA